MRPRLKRDFFVRGETFAIFDGAAIFVYCIDICDALANGRREAQAQANYGHRFATTLDAPADYLC